MIRVYLALGALAIAYVAGGWTVYQLWSVADHKAEVDSLNAELAGLKDANARVSRMAVNAAKEARDVRFANARLREIKQDVTAIFRDPADSCLYLKHDDIDRLYRIPTAPPPPPPAPRQ